MKSSQKTKVCIVIPAYNEAAVIGDIIKEAYTSLSKMPFLFEIVVVNDNSRDATANKARQAGATVIEHILNFGAGSATATGLSYASKNGATLAVTMDADGQHDIKDVIKGIDVMTKSNIDLLIGSRLINSQGMSKVKILGNRGLSFITALIFGIRTTDSQSGLRLFSRRALEQLRWDTSGYEFCSEMLWRAKQLGLTISEYPIKAIYTDYSKSKGQNNWNAINIVTRLLKRRVAELLG